VFLYKKWVHPSHFSGDHEHNIQTTTPTATTLLSFSKSYTGKQKTKTVAWINVTKRNSFVFYSIKWVLKERGRISFLRNCL